MHRTTEQFWRRYWGLPKEVRDLADSSFERLKANPSHPALRFKKVGDFWSARVGSAFRVLAVADGDDFIWVWIGSHDNYTKMIRKR